MVIRSFREWCCIFKFIYNVARWGGGDGKREEVWYGMCGRDWDWKWIG